MFAKVFSAAVNGIEAYPVEVEVNSGWGDSVIVIVGLPDAAVRESRDRVTTAIRNSGFKLPLGRTTINLAPADVKKEGPSFDLPIAIAMLSAADQIAPEKLEDVTLEPVPWLGIASLYDRNHRKGLSKSGLNWLWWEN